MIIKRVEIRNLWGQDIFWDLNSDVNVLIGVNGSGKSTVLRLIEEALSPKRDLDLNYEVFYQIDEMIIELEEGLIVWVNSEKRKINKPKLWESLAYTVVNTFDVPFPEKPSDKSYLDIVISQLEQAFTKYRLEYISQQVDSLKENGNGKTAEERIGELEKISNNESLLVSRLNELFTDTKKTFDIHTFSFRLEGLSNQIALNKLSSGEKQLFIILLQALLSKGKPHIFFLDEPEISLHIRWQRRLISLMLELNPDAQIILTTHSATIFYLTWESKIFRMEKLLQTSNLSRKSTILQEEKQVSEEIFERLKKNFEFLTQPIVQKEPPYPNPIFRFNSLLSQYFMTLSLEIGKNILNYLKENHIAADIFTLNLLLELLLSYEECKLLFPETFKEYNILPNVSTLNILLKKIDTIREGLRDINVFQTDFQIAPDVASFKTLLGKVTHPIEIETIEYTRNYYSIPADEGYKKRLMLRE